MNESAPHKPETATVIGSATPAMAQFLALKADHPDALLFYRMGDFYELFFDDAVNASKTLGITLTKRGRHGGEDIPMCGVPVRTSEDYLQKLIAAGHRVAVCEQMEDPAEAKKRGNKSVVRRDMVRLVTPGTITEDTLLDAGQNSFLAAIARERADEDSRYSIAWCDLSTGEFSVQTSNAVDLPGDLARISPSEVLVPESIRFDLPISDAFSALDLAQTPLPNVEFDSVSAADHLKSYFSVATLDGFAALNRSELAASAAIVRYLDRTQVGRKAALNPPRQLAGHAAMAIDAATRANLELSRTLKGDAKGSLIATIDRTVTAPGRRRLAEQICGPLTDPVAINARLDAVERLVDKASLRDRLRDILKTVPDMARALSRISLERGGPRDLTAIRDGIAGARALGDLLKADAVGDVPVLAGLAQTLRDADAAFEAELGAALIDTPPLLGREGGFVRAGYRVDLDELRTLRDESRRVVASMQNEYADITDVKALKIRHNNVLGYFIEVTAQHGAKLFEHEDFIHRQTMANAVRFTTVALGELESKIVSAGDKALILEQAVLSTLFEAAMARVEAIKLLANALATLDVFLSHADLARSRGFSRPIVDGSLSFRIKGGRHPVVEAALDRDGSGPFVANDCDLSPAEDAEVGAVWLLTGPNMGGKSTYLRQNALIAILAQAGSYVPAQSAHIGIVDRLFSRVGASDDLARGRSTFMVEMVETAAILNQASPASLVILDEIGRGTATFDGLSIAWASVEHLHDVNKCRAVFATHFHELTVLAARLDRVHNATVKVKEWDGDVIFLHEVAPGAADRSYGVQVAKLAGLPQAVVERARAVLDILEASEREGGAKSVIDDLPLFSTLPPPRPSAGNAEYEALKDRINALLPDHMSPRDALDALYALKDSLKD